MRQSNFPRLIDRFVGPLLLTIIGSMRRHREIPEDIRDIAILKSAAIGDTVLLSAIVQDLQRHIPGVKITLFVGSSNREIATCLSGVSRVIQLPLNKPLQAVSIARQHAFDIWMDGGSWPRIDALISALSRSKCVIGFSTPGESRDQACDIKIAHRDSVHELDNFRALLTPLDATTTSLPRLECGKTPSPVQGKFVIFHLHAGSFLGPFKAWPLGNWERLGRALIAQGFEILLTGSRENQAANEELAQRLGKNTKNIAGLALRETMSTMLQTHLVVSVDSGIMHIASTLQIPVVALFGASDPIRWGPIGNPETIRIVTPPPCQNRFFIKKGNENPVSSQPMHELAYSDVENACLALLESQINQPTIRIES